MKKLLINVLKGIIVGNFIANLAYLLTYFLGGREGLTECLQDLSIDNNYLKMIIYASLSGIIVLLPLYGYKKFSKRILEIENMNVGKKRYAINVLLIFVSMLIVFVMIKLVQLIYIQEVINTMYLLIIVVLWTIIGVFKFFANHGIREEIKWLNENLKKRK